MKPTISVILTCYNQEKYIKKCLDGIVMQQNCPPFEVIVGDDCSTDNTRKIISTYAKKYKNITVLDRKKNVGMLNNLKQCFENCRGEYIAICEGDDYWTDKEKLKKQYDALSRDDDAYICFSNIKLLEDGKFINHVPKQKQKITDKITVRDMLDCNYIANFSCVMYKKQAINLVPRSYWKNNLNADYIMHLYMLNASKHAIFLKKPMGVYRILKHSISHKDAYPISLIKFIRMMETFNKATRCKYQEKLDKLYEKVFPVVSKNVIVQQYKRLLGISVPCFSKRFFVGIGLKNRK